jgi:hypothetical protein
MRKPFRQRPGLRLIEGGLSRLSAYELRAVEIARSLTPERRRIWLEAGKMLARGVPIPWVQRWIERKTDELARRPAG